ncbi:MAG: dihydrodipicolinate synthase family protein [Chloroflexi bacterium]|nr:dihydrodipicolinate synthase family protein [Chloroflexota bacterium]
MATYTKEEAQEWAKEALKGQWTTLITPFTPDDEFDDTGMRHNIRHIQKLGTRGAGCTWGMGEFWSLTHEERLKVMEVVADESQGKWLIGAHVTHTSARAMIDLARNAETMGYDVLIVAPPYMVTKTEEQVVEWVRYLAEKTSLAIMFYNSPQFGIVLSPSSLKQLCQIPNVVGVKEASFNQQLSIETHLSLGKDHVISTPDEWIFWKAKELGFEQQVMFSNTSDWRFDVPEANYYVQFIDKATEGNLDEPFYDKHLRRIKELSDTWWTRTVDQLNGALPIPMVKYWGELMGLSAGHARAPLADMTAEQKSELRRELEPMKPKPPVHAVPAQPVNDRVSWLTGNNAFFSGMLLMVSVQNVAEALEAERGGADVVDVKNLQEAMVGSGHPSVVREVRSQIQPENHVSVTLGVVPNQAGTVAMAAYAAASLNATSVKIGFRTTDYDTAVDILQQSRRAMEGFNTKLVGSVFADNLLYDGGLDPMVMVQLAKDGQCDGFLIDTLTKDGRNLFDFIPEAKLKEMVLQGKEMGMSTALSGHLKISDLDELARINPDIVGVRGAVCGDGDRGRSVAWEAVAEFKHQLDMRKTGEVNVFAEGNGFQGASFNEAMTMPSNGSGGSWVVIDGRGKSCAGVIAALARQMEYDDKSLVEAILADALNIYDVILWAEQGKHNVLNHRKDADGTVRVLIQP